MFEYNEGIYTFYVYILTNIKKNVLYIGVTNNLKRRLHEHKTSRNPQSFTARYNVHYLVHFEKFTWIQQAIEREKELKKLSRINKETIIKEFNPELKFLNHYFED